MTPKAKEQCSMLGAGKSTQIDLCTYYIPSKISAKRNEERVKLMQWKKFEKKIEHLLRRIEDAIIEVGLRRPDININSSSQL